MVAVAIVVCGQLFFFRCRKKVELEGKRLETYTPIVFSIDRNTMTIHDLRMFYLEMWCEVDVGGVLGVLWACVTELLRSVYVWTYIYVYILTYTYIHTFVFACPYIHIKLAQPRYGTKLRIYPFSNTSSQRVVEWTGVMHTPRASIEMGLEEVTVEGWGRIYIKGGVRNVHMCAWVQDRRM